MTESIIINGDQRENSSLDLNYSEEVDNVCIDKNFDKTMKLTMALDSDALVDSNDVPSTELTSNYADMINDKDDIITIVENDDNCSLKLHLSDDDDENETENEKIDLIEKLDNDNTVNIQQNGIPVNVESDSAAEAESDDNRQTLINENQVENELNKETDTRTVETDNEISDSQNENVNANDTDSNTVEQSENKDHDIDEDTKQNEIDNKDQDESEISKESNLNCNDNSKQCDEVNVENKSVNDILDDIDNVLNEHTTTSSTTSVSNDISEDSQIKNSEINSETLNEEIEKINTDDDGIEDKNDTEITSVSEPPTTVDENNDDKSTTTTNEEKMEVDSGICVNDNDTNADADADADINDNDNDTNADVNDNDTNADVDVDANADINDNDTNAEAETDADAEINDNNDESHSTEINDKIECDEIEVDKTDNVEINSNTLIDDHMTNDPIISNVQTLPQESNDSDGDGVLSENETDVDKETQQIEEDKDDTEEPSTKSDVLETDISNNDEIDGCETITETEIVDELDKVEKNQDESIAMETDENIAMETDENARIIHEQLDSNNDEEITKTNNETAACGSLADAIFLSLNAENDIDIGETKVDPEPEVLERQTDSNKRRLDEENEEDTNESKKLKKSDSVEFESDNEDKCLLDISESNTSKKDNQKTEDIDEDEDLKEEEDEKGEIDEDEKGNKGEIDEEDEKGEIDEEDGTDAKVTEDEKEDELKKPPKEDPTKRREKLILKLLPLLFENEALQQVNVEEFILTKLVETISLRTELAALRQKSQTQEHIIDQLRKKSVHLTKQLEDITTVCHRLQLDLTNKDRPVAPVKITRSVGLQVTIPAVQPKRIISSNNIHMRKRSHSTANNTSQNIAPTPPKTSTKSNTSNNTNNASNTSNKAQSPSILNSALTKPTKPTKPTTRSANVTANNSTPPPQQTTQNTETTPVNSKTSQNKDTTPKKSGDKPVIDLTDEEDNSKNKNNTVVNPPNLIPLSTSNITRMVSTLGGTVSTNSQPQQRVAYLMATSAVPGQKGQQLLIATSATAGPRPTLVVSQPNMKGQSQQGARYMIQNTNGQAPISIQRPGIVLANGQPPSTVRVPVRVNNSSNRNNLSAGMTTRTSANLTTNGHPAPLPITLNQSHMPNWRLIPPRPALRIGRSKDGGIQLSWSMPDLDVKIHEDIASYQLYAYQESSAPPSTDLWRKVGDVKALPLPMACTLTSFHPGNKYYFAVRAIDVHSRVSQFSYAQPISLQN